jgi:hypothetical protein
MYPEAFGLEKEEDAKPKRDTSGFKAALSAGATRLGGQTELLKGKLGIQSEAEAQKKYEAAEAKASERFTPTEKGFTEAPFLKVRELLGGSLPYAAAPAAAGIAALAAPVSVPVAAGLGLLGAGAVSTGQFTASNLARQVDEGKSLEEASLGKAAAAAVPQALIDTAAMALLPGVGKLFSSVGSKLTTEQAKAIANQTLSKAAMDYTAKTGMAMGREGLTEVAQQSLERLQAGLSITDPEARKEYIDSFIGGAVLGGTLAPVGRAFERSGAKSQAAKADREERNVAAKEAAEQERIAAEQEEAKRQTPEYALEVAKNLQTLEQEKIALQQQVRKITKNSPTEAEDKAFNKDIQAQLKANSSARNELAPEVNRLKQSGVYQQALQQQEAQQFELTAPPAETVAAQGEETTDAKALLERKRQAQQLLEQNQQELSAVTAAGDMAQFDAGMKLRKALQKEIGQIDAQLKKAGVEDVQTDPAAIQEQIDKEYAKLTSMAGAGFDPDKAERQRTKITKLETQLQTVAGGQQGLDLGAPRTLELPLTAAQKQREALAARGTAAGQERVAGVEAEEQAALEEQRAQTDRDIQEAQREQALGGEFAGLQRMQAAPAGISDQFGLFGTEQAAPAGSAAMGQMQQKLTGEDVTFTAEEEKKRDLRRVPGAEFKLRGRNEGTAPVTRDELADRLNRVLSTYDLSPEAVDLLQRAEKALPQSGADYFALLDEQLAQIESGAEGVPRKGQERTLDLQTFPAAPAQQARASTTAPTEAGERQVKQITGARPGEAASGLKTPIAQPEAEDRRTGVRGAADVTKRVADTTPSTLRGPSARAGELSLARELEEPLLRQEEAAREDTGQKSLFPEEQEKLGAIKGNRGAFQMFMKSKFVQNLRQQLRRDEEIAKRAQAIPALEKRANGLIAEIEDILQQYAEYRSADAVVKANKDVAKAKRDMAEIRAAAGKATVDRMVLAGAIEDLKQARKQVIEQGYGEGGVQELIANIDTVNDQLQAAQSDMALLNSALSVLDGQMQSFAAVQKLSSLLDKAPSVFRIDQAKQEFAAVRAELDVLQKENNELQARLQKDAADKRRADEAVKEAERKAQVEAGRLKPSERAINNLPRYDQATQYPALTEAQLLARENGGKAPTLSAYEQTQINGVPEQVLGGYRARVTGLEKLIQQSQDKSKTALAKDMVEPTQNLRDALDKAYKKAKSAAERDVLGPKLDAAEAKLAQAKAELANTPVIWIGMKSQINKLADAIIRVEWLEGLIAEGKVELAPGAKETRRTAPTKEEKAATRAAQAKAAAERTTAPSTSGEALTRSEAAKARQPQKTLFEGKGSTDGTAVEIPMTPAERLAAMQKTAAQRNKNAQKAELSRGAPVDGGQTVAALEKALDKVVGDPGVAGKRINLFQSVSDLFNTPKYSSVYDGADIPSDAKAFVNPENGEVFMFADNIGKGEALGVLLHEIGVHVGFRNLFNKTQYARLVSTVKGWAKRNDNSQESLISKRAVARVEAAKTTPDQYDDELLAYTVEEAIKAGVNPDALKGGSPIRNWLKAVMDVLRNALSKYGINPKTMTSGDLVNMAYGAAQLELRGTWHGSDAVFTAFDSKFSGAGEGSYEQRFAGSTNLGKGPYVTPNKEYAEYYQHAVPFGKAANAAGYGTKTYQDYRDMDDMFLMTPNKDLSTAALQSKFESRVLTAYLEGVSAGQSLDPAQNKKALAILERLQKGARDAKEQKAVSTLSLQKIKPLKEYPAKGNLYRTMDDIPRAQVFGVNEKHTLGERPKLDALMRKYAFDSTKEMADKIGWWAGNGLFYNMRDKLGIDKTINLLKDAGISVIEAQNEGTYIERAYIDQAPEILGMNLNPVGSAGYKLMFSRGAPANALESLAQDITSQPKTIKEKMGSNLALQAEMQAVDMRAGLRDALKFGDDTLFTQAMYHVRKAEQKMAQMFTVMNSGPLVAYKDEKGLVGYRSSNQNSAREVFDAIADIPVDDPQLKTNIAQAYMVAQRAQNKGLSKLDFGELGLTEEKLKAALAAADADPALKNALENVRRKYNAYNKGLIEFLASTGRISKKTAADLLKDGDYVPYYRVRDNGMAELNFGNNVTFNVGDIRRQPYLAELKGGETKLLPLNEAIQQNTLLLTDMALTNNAAKSVAYGLQALGKGMGPVDPKTGKRTNLMPIKTGFGPDDARVVRFYQEPDPNDPKDTGERHIVVETKGTLAEGIPAELVVQSLEGASLALPGFLKLGGAAADLLRAGVTRTPLYIARKLVREPMAAAFTGGLNNNAFSAVFKAGAEFLRMSTGSSDAQAKLIEKGLIQSNIFAGDMSDMKKMALQLASGKDQSVLDKVFAAADRYAMRADAATLALVLKNAEANGLSEVEADMMTMESMNFYKRGLSPTLQYASRLIPFFNAQIQGLNVLAKAARGNMPFEEQQQIKRKFFNNALLLTATGLVYAMAMEDDETFRNARPRDKYSNFFMPIPGVDEPLKLPIPFEAGYFFSLAVAAVDSMRAETDGKAQWQAVRDLFLGSIPGYSSMGIPQIVKPAFEVWTNKNFLTGGNVESLRFQGLDPEARYLATTTELAKQMSKAVPILSPIQIEHLVRGYLGVLPLVAAAGANSLFEREDKGAKPEGRASDLPLIGSAFQKKYGGADADVVFREVDEIMQTRNTFNDMLKSGRREEAAEYRDKHRVELAMASAAGQYRQVIGRINADVRRTQERNDLTPEEKRLRLDALDKAKQDRAEAFLKLQRRAEENQR